MLDAKRALDANVGDMDAAKRWLREKGLVSAGQRQGRTASEGAVAVAVSEAGSAIVELRSETDFVAKSAEFVALVDDLATLAASKGVEALAEREKDVEDLQVSLKENISIGAVKRLEQVPDRTVGSYLHLQADRGVNAVIVEVAGADENLAHEIAVHIAFARPTYVSRDEVPSVEVETERATLETISRNEGKPEGALSKIVEGRLRGWFKERVLLDQAYVRDEKRTVADVLGDARVTRFAQVVVGS